MRIVQEPIADGVGQRRLPDVIVPLGRGELARDDRGAAPIPVLENLEEVAALLVLRRRQPQSSRLIIPFFKLVEFTWRPRRQPSTSHPFAHTAHNVVFDRRRQAVVEEGRPNQ